MKQVPWNVKGVEATAPTVVATDISATNTSLNATIGTPVSLGVTIAPEDAANKNVIYTVEVVKTGEGESGPTVTVGADYTPFFPKFLH